MVIGPARQRDDGPALQVPRPETAVRHAQGRARHPFEIHGAERTRNQVEPGYPAGSENQVEYAGAQALDQVLRQGLIQLKDELGVAFVQRPDQRGQPRHRDDLGNAHAQYAWNGLRGRDPFTNLGGEFEKLFHVADQLAPLGGDPRRPL